MPPHLALALGVIVVAVLLAIERKRMPAPSLALWLPTLWIFFVASRPLSRWLSSGGSNAEGNLTDRLSLAVMIAVGVLVLARRKISWQKVFRDNVWLFAFFGFILISAAWTDVPFTSLKRSIRSAGAIVMALVVMSESAPLLALDRVLRRTAYVMIPISIVFIKYFPDLGRAYGRSDGVVMWTGVTTQKNTLGALCALSVILIVIGRFRKADAAPRSARLQRYADFVVLLMAVFLLRGAEEGNYSATATAVTILGVGIALWMLPRRRGGALIAANLRTVAVVATVAYLAFWNAITTTGATMLGRRPDLTGRSVEIWPLVLKEAAKHPILGSGYGGVWGLDGELSRTLGLEQAHNGYLDVYLQLGVVGCVLLALFLLEVCGRIKRQYRYDRSWGVFGIAFFFINLIYNISETAFFDVYFGAALVFASVVFGASDTATPQAASQDAAAPAAVPVGGFGVVRTTPAVPVPVMRRAATPGPGVQARRQSAPRAGHRPEARFPGRPLIPRRNPPS